MADCGPSCQLCIRSDFLLRSCQLCIWSNLLLCRYKSDFGATDLEVLKFVARFLTLKERDKLEALISEGKYKIEYQPYDWSANSAE